MSFQGKEIRVYLREISVRYRLKRVRAPASDLEHLRSPGAAARVFTSLLGREIVEVCGLVCLTARLDVLAYHELSRGTLNHTLVYPTDVYRTALLTNAAAVVVGHNHPSGNPTPSPDDVTLTQRLATAGQLLGIELADHLIVTAEGRYFSFKESGQL